MTFIVSLFVLVNVFIALPGCHKESVRVNDAKQEMDPQIKELEETFKSIGTWQAYRDVCRKIRFFGGVLDRKINDVKDPATRMKYFTRLCDLAFSVPLDATDPATRSYQLTSFFVMTDDVHGCAQENDDQTQRQILPVSGNPNVCYDQRDHGNGRYSAQYDRSALKDPECRAPVLVTRSRRRDHLSREPARSQDRALFLPQGRYERLHPRGAELQRPERGLRSSRGEGGRCLAGFGQEPR